MPTGPKDASRRPFTLGNVWHSREASDGALEYLSDQWGGRTFGFEERERVTLAQSDEVAVGVVAVGGGSCGVTRPLAERYPYHLRNEGLEADEADLSAEAQAAGHLAILDARHHALPTMIAVSEPCASTLEADVLPGSDLRERVKARVAAAARALQPWKKRLFVDRIGLSLLEGAKDIPQSTADFHYAAIAQGLRLDVSEQTGQPGLPAIVVSQNAGTRGDGTSEVILAEGRLHWNHFALGIVVATPKYPFEIMRGTTGTLSAQSALLVSELESLALDAVQHGEDWYCPSMEEAHWTGDVIQVRFAALSDLVLEDGPHGFSVSEGKITDIKVSGTDVMIALEDPPTGPVTLSYAFGQTVARQAPRVANHGALRDSWEKPSRLSEGVNLHRFALSGRVTVRGL